jgi:hypothetical protein
MPTPPRSVRPLPLTRRRSERQGSPKLFPPRQRPHRRCHACPVRPSFRPRRFCSSKGLGLESAGSTASPCPAYPADSPGRTSSLHGPAASGRPPTGRANPRRPTRARPGPSSLPVHRRTTPASPTSRERRRQLRRLLDGEHIPCRESMYRSNNERSRVPCGGRVGSEVGWPGWPPHLGAGCLRGDTMPRGRSHRGRDRQGGLARPPPTFVVGDVTVFARRSGCRE